MDVTTGALILSALLAAVLVVASALALYLALQWVIGYVRMHRRRTLVLPGYRAMRPVVRRRE